MPPTISSGRQHKDTGSSVASPYRHQNQIQTTAKEYPNPEDETSCGDDGGNGDRRCSVGSNTSVGFERCVPEHGAKHGDAGESVRQTD